MKYAAVAVALLACAGSAQAALIVVPNAQTASEGNTNNGFPYNIGTFALPSQRYQQVYGASDFASAGGPVLISALIFRPDATFGNAFNSTLPNIRIDLSTTSAAPDALSTTFANNVGANNTIVFSGALTLSSADAPGPGGTRAFDIVINLTTPFLYDPTQGNLLMDVRNFGDGITTQFDAHSQTGDAISRVSTNNQGNVNSPVANFSDTAGLVTQFRFELAAVPEPGSLTLLAIGAVSLAGYAVRRRRKAP